MISAVKYSGVKVAIKTSNLTSLWTMLLLALSGCSVTQDTDLVSVTGLTMGTSYTVKWWAHNDIDTDWVRAGVQSELARIEASMSTYTNVSDVSGFNGVGRNLWYPVPLEMVRLINLAQEISVVTDGAFDITVGPLVNLWGFGPDPKPSQIPTNSQLNAMRPRIGYQKLQVKFKPPALLKTADASIDLSAIAKGYGVDVVSSWLQQQGVHNFLVEVGGELRASGYKPDKTPWRIAIETPTVNARQVYQIVEIRDMAVATSGNYRNYYEAQGVRYAHTLDPATLRPVIHKLASVTVLDQSAARADALATALMVMGDEKGLTWARQQQQAAHFIIQTEAGLVAQTSGNFSQYMVQ
jgi:thiamine biosynthesis lipoprotein